MRSLRSRPRSRGGVRHCPSSQAKATAFRLSANRWCDKITTVPKTKIGARVGRLSDEGIVRLNRAVLVFLGIAAPAASEQLE